MIFDESLLVNERIMAVDIGENGGFVCNDTLKDLGFADMPKSAKDRWECISFTRPQRIVAENVHAFPGNAAAASGKLLINRGQIEGFAGAMNVPITWIEPLKWIECFTMKRKKHFDKREHWKKHLRDIAKELAPERYRGQINLKTCDAFLIWYYFASQQTSNPIKPLGLII